MVRVLLVTHYFPEHRSGVEIAAGQLAEALSHSGCRITWVASSTDACGVDDQARIRRITVPTWNIAERLLGFCWPIWGPLSILRLFRHVRECDLVHIHEYLYLGNMFAFLYAKLLRKPVVVTQHASMIPYKSRLVRLALACANRLLGRLVLTGASRCFFISAKAMAYFRELLPFARPPEFLPNGVNTELFHPLATEDRETVRSTLKWEGHLVALFVGRFVELKRLDLMQALARRFPEIRWVFVGTGPLSPEPWRLPNVEIVGSLPQRDIARFYQAADLLVLPSVGEGFPLVVQEAMACGTPALITKDTARGAPGVEDVALTAEPTVESLANAVRAVVDAPDYLARQRAAVAEYAVNQWNWERCSRRYVEAFQLLTSPEGAVASATNN